MPIYDPAIRGASSVGASGGTSAVVPKPAGTVNGDLIVVFGNVGGGVQLNAPDGTWTRVNGITSSYQAFWKLANGESASWTFTWDGANRAYILNGFSSYSQG